MAACRPQIFICIFAAALMASCGPSKESSGRVFLLADEEIDDNPSKTQIKKYFVAPLNRPGFTGGCFV